MKETIDVPRSGICYHHDFFSTVWTVSLDNKSREEEHFPVRSQTTLRG